MSRLEEEIICRKVLTLSAKLQIKSIHVADKTRTAAKCTKMKKKNARAKRAKMLSFIIKYAHLWRCCWRRRRGSLNSLLT